MNPGTGEVPRDRCWQLTRNPGCRPDVSGMLGEILVGALVIAVAVLVAVDISRTKSDSPHGHADGSAHDARPSVTGDIRGARLEAYPQESTGTGMAAAVRDAEPARRPEK